MSVSIECVTVTDTARTDWSSIACGDTTYDYTVWIGSYRCGESEYRNVARMVGDTIDEQSEHLVYITVDCQDVGCTKTPGYWKTHSEYGPAPYDLNWLLVGGADANFPNTNPTNPNTLSWYKMFWTSPAGNVWYNLARAWGAAELNRLSGANADAVSSAMSAAQSLLEKFTPVNFMVLKPQDKDRKAAVELSRVLDEFNNGLTETPHCDMESQYIN